MGYTLTPDEFRKLLKARRGARSLREVGADLMAPSHLSKIERRGGAGLTVGSLVSIAECYEVSLLELLRALVGGVEWRDLLALIEGDPEFRKAAEEAFGDGGRLFVEAKIPSELQDALREMLAKLGRFSELSERIEDLEATNRQLVDAVVHMFGIVERSGALSEALDLPEEIMEIATG